jgi:hypothetical protein
MAKRKPHKLHPNNLPTRLPVWPAITLWLVLDRAQAPGWVWGATYTFIGLWFFATVLAMINEVWVNHFNNEV